MRLIGSSTALESIISVMIGAFDAELDVVEADEFGVCACCVIIFVDDDDDETVPAATAAVDGEADEADDEFEVAEKVPRLLLFAPTEVRLV